jgi:hypothetical protein
MMCREAALHFHWLMHHLLVLNMQAHAVDTYGEFVDANEELLKSLPPPLVAAE